MARSRLGGPTHLFRRRQPIRTGRPARRGQPRLVRPPRRAWRAERASAIVYETAFKDPAAEREKLRGLYDSLQQARDQVGERNRLPFDQFADLIQSQVAKLQSGSRSAVAFLVKVEGGRVKVTAKAVKGAGHDGER